MKNNLYKIVCLIFSLCIIGVFAGCNSCFSCAEEEVVEQPPKENEYCEHEWEITDEKADTCLEDGYIYSTCSICGREKRQTLNAGHDFVDGFCTRCNESIYSKGLTYSYDAYKEEYTVTGRGTCVDTIVKIPTKYQGKPVTKISNSAFANHPDIEGVEIPDGITEIGGSAFMGCTGLKEIALPTITTLSANTFQNCTSLESIGLKEGLIEIGAYAFDGCTTLTDIEIPETVEKLGDYVFGNADTLTEITLPNTVDDLGSYAFYGCDGLKTISLSTALTQLKYATFYNCSSLESVKISSNIWKVNDYVFYNCKNLENVEIENGVTRIGRGAFSLCEKLQEINIPASVTTINNKAFNECVNLSRITIDNNNSIYTSANGNCIIEKANNTLVIGCKGTIIPNSVTTIGDYAFENCKSLQGITIPNNVTSIKDYAFHNCTGLQSVTFGNNSQLTSIDNGAFQNCRSLQGITIPNNVTSIGERVFRECNSLTYNVEGNLKYLGNSTNKYLYLAKTTSNDITNVAINENCKFIDIYAFCNCYNLKSLNIPASVTKIILNYYHSISFDLENITVDANNPVFKSAGNCVIERQTNTLVYGCKNSVIPSYVNTIEKSAFSYCVGLSSFEIPNSITSIANCAFMSSSLTSITISASVTSIGDQAFDYCYNLQNITYKGTKSQWQSVSKSFRWKEYVPATVVHCIDGDVAI